MTNLVVGLVVTYISVVFFSFISNVLLGAMEDTLVENSIIIKGFKAKESRRILLMSLIPVVNVMYFLYLFLQVVVKLIFIAYISRKFVYLN